MYVGNNYNIVETSRMFNVFLAEIETFGANINPMNYNIVETSRMFNVFLAEIETFGANINPMRGRHPRDSKRTYNALSLLSE